MFVFLSWSGERSKAMAESLAGWLCRVIQAVEPWISIDIEKGTRWGVEIAERLERSRFGVICLTRDNLESKWIHWEAGALSKTKEARVYTLLLDIQPTDVKQPLAQFQHTVIEKEDVYRLVQDINRAVKESEEKFLEDDVLRDVFENYWTSLETRLQAISRQGGSPRPTRSDSDVLQEILELLRRQENRQLRSEYSLHSLAAILGQPPSSLEGMLARQALLDLGPFLQLYGKKKRRSGAEEKSEEKSKSEGLTLEDKEKK